MFEDCTCANYFEQFVHVVTHKSAPLISLLFDFAGF